MSRLPSMSRVEMISALRSERLMLAQERLDLRRQIGALQKEIDGIDSRLTDIDHAEGLLA